MSYASEVAYNEYLEIDQIAAPHGGVAKKAVADGHTIVMAKDGQCFEFISSHKTTYPIADMWRKIDPPQEKDGEVFMDIGSWSRWEKW